MVEKNVHVLYGTEYLLMDAYIQKLQDQYILEDEMDFAVSHYDLEEVLLEQILEDASTPPFFGAYKLLVVHQAFIFTGEKIKLSHNLEKLLSYLASPAPFTILVFLVPKEKLDERKKITKKCKETAVVQGFLAPKKDADFLHYIQETCKSYQIQIHSEAAQQLYMLVGGHLSLIHQEIEKCYTYLLSEQKKVIDVELVNRLVSRSIEDNVFLLMDYLMKKNPTQAVFVLNDLKKQRVEPILILGALTANFRLFYQLKIMVEQLGYSENEMAKRLKISPYRVKFAMPVVKRLKEDILRNWLKWIADLDVALKSYRLDGYLSLELFMLRFQSW
ncbi:MAG: DNA polymerase III subunit delta [Bacillales bacterium]|nr:DNA polymerase III subunit delta [Bacillales bacterium]